MESFSSRVSELTERYLALWSESPGAPPGRLRRFTAADKALSYLYKNRAETSKGSPDHWALIAIAKLLPYCDQEACPGASRKDLTQYAIQVCNWIVHEQLRNPASPLDGAFDPPGQTAAVAARLEGLLAALEFLPNGELRAKVEAAVGRALERLDLPTKVRLLTGFDFWTLYPIPEIGLRVMVLSDGPAGVKGGSIGHDETTTSLPSPTALAATWDEDLIHEVGELLAGVARGKGVDILLGPTINLHRSPLGGRHFEQFSEDPLLTGRIAAAYVSGLQARGVGGCPKHYVCNDSETERQSYTVDVAERPLRELYMAPFERTVRETQTWSVMAVASPRAPLVPKATPLRLINS